MSFKKFLISAVLSLIALSSTVLAYPGKEELNEFHNYFNYLFENQKIIGPECAEYSNEFNKNHDFWGKPFSIDMFKTWRDALEKEGKGNCWFSAAALYLKLKELGFETYIIFNDFSHNPVNGDTVHFSVLYKTNFDTWFVADLGVEFGEAVHKLFTFSSMIPLKEYLFSYTKWKQTSHTYIFYETDSGIFNPINIHDFVKQHITDSLNPCFS